MSDNAEANENIRDWKIHSYFCIDDKDDRTMAALRDDAVVLKKERKTVHIRGKKIEGWIIHLKIPATDGLITLDHHESSSATYFSEERHI